MPNVNNVGPGWHPYVEPLIEEVNRLGGTVHQIKEKFGGLRFYYGLPDKVTEADIKAMFDLVSTAEQLCSNACEECGEPAMRTNTGWIKTLCGDHAKERQRKQEESDNEYAKRYGKGQKSNV